MVNKNKNEFCHSAFVKLSDSLKVNSITLHGDQSTGSSYHDSLFNSGQLVRPHIVNEF
jgi:hypothetical protein